MVWKDKGVGHQRKKVKKVKLGKYQHYKGNFYQVIGVARHSETLEEMVIYQAEYNHPKLFSVFIH